MRHVRGSSSDTADNAGTETNVKETFALDADETTLEIEISISTSDATRTSTLRYARIQDVGPCDTWPSPCKDFSSFERK